MGLVSIIEKDTSYNSPADRFSNFYQGRIGEEKELLPGNVLHGLVVYGNFFRLSRGMSAH